MNSITRRQFMISLGGVAAALSLSDCGFVADRPVRIASHVWPGYELMFLAREQGWLDGSRVHLIETTSASDSLHALAEGRVDGAALTLDEVLTARSRGIALSVVMIFDVSAGADMLLARPGIEKLSDLKGRRIGVEQGAVGSLMLASILRSADLKKEDVAQVLLTIDRQADAWAQVDAVITYEPVASKLQDLGAVKLFDSREIPDTIVDVLAIRSDALDHSHARAVRHLLAAHFQALDYFNRNPYDSAFRMASRLRLQADGVLSEYKGLLLPDADNNRRLLAGARPELLETARRVCAIMIESGLLPREDRMIGLLRAEFLPVAGIN